MFYSKRLPSSEGAIWIAAFFFKRLKKAQIKDTDIASSVDKILQNEMNFDSYRVLAYLLLGVVRIYSKKVEYLFHDCNEVLIKIKNFTIDTKNNANKETLRMSITIPDRFELDAFDLDIVEDVDAEAMFRGNIASNEEITLKDVSWNDEGIGKFSLDKYLFKEFDFCQDSCSTDHLTLDDVNQSQPVDYNFEVSPQNSPLNLRASDEKFQESLFSQEEPVNFDPTFVIEGVLRETVYLFTRDQQINKDMTVLETALEEDEILEEKNMKKLLCEISQEKPVDTGRFSRRDEELTVSVEQSNESHLVCEEEIKAKEVANLECQMHPDIGDMHNKRSLPVNMEKLQTDRSNRKEFMDLDRPSIANEMIEEIIEVSVEKHDNNGKINLQVSIEDEMFDEELVKAKETTNSECQMHPEIGEVFMAKDSPLSMERPQDYKSNKEECMDHDRFSVGKEKIENLIEGVEKNNNRGRFKLGEKVSIEDDKFHVIPPQSKSLEITPQTKFPSGSVAKPNPGATTPESMLISTPAVRERARFSSKRKCVIDRLIVLPNEVLKQRIQDASDLISKRRKFRHPRLAVWRASRISSLPEGFYESLLPLGHSSELQILFSVKKIKISSLEVVETPGKFDESQTIGSLVPDEPAPRTPPQCSKTRTAECQESTRTLDFAYLSPSSSHECIERDNLSPSSPHECIESEKSLKKDEEFHLVKECNVETSSSYESMRREQCLRKDEELNLMNEFQETNSLESENSDLCGWSGRTMKVARYLHKNFLELRKQRDGEVVNFSQILGGRTDKECARLFYEILVLRSTSCVDLKQNNAYSDILLWKLPKLDQTFEVDSLQTNIRE